jgi:hypothetical protein
VRDTAFNGGNETERERGEGEKRKWGRRGSVRHYM